MTIGEIMHTSLRTILQAVELLVKPAGGNTSKEKSKEFNLDGLLSQNIDSLRHFAKSVPSDSLNLCLEKQDSEGDTRWKFVEISLTLLDRMIEAMAEAVQLYKQTHQEPSKGKSPADSAAPPVSPDVLSFSQQKHVTTLVQFIVCLGVCPNLHPGVGIPLAKRSGFAQLIKGNESVTDQLKEWRLLRFLSTMLQCAQQPSLGSLILSTHLGDLIASLAQLSYGTGSKLKSDAKPGSHLATCGENTSSLGVGSDASPADGVNAARERNKETTKQESSEVKDETIDGSGTTENFSEAEVKNEAKQQEVKDLHVSNRFYGDYTVTDDDRRWCREEQQQLLDRVYPPLVVRELLILQTGIPGFPKVPVWLRKFCSHVLSQKLVRPRGVQYVLRGMLEGTTGSSSASDWRKCDAAAKVIANFPKSIKSANEYYSKIAPQVLELLHIKDKNLARQFLRVATSTISAMVTNHPAETKTHLIDPLLKPLTSCLEKSEFLNGKSDVVIEEGTLTTCIEDIHKVFVSSEPQIPLLKYLEPVLPVLFELLFFTSSSASQLRSLCEHVLNRYLRHNETNHVVNLIYVATFNMTLQMICGGMDPLLGFSPGPSGGVQVIKATGNNETSFDVKMSCIIRLLKGVNSGDVTANLFLRLLQDLSEVINKETKQTEEKEAETASAPEETLFNIEQKVNVEVEKITHSLMVVQLLAEMSEQVGPSCFKNTSHILQFAQVTLERGVHVLQHTEDEGFGLLESETVSMAMGLLTAVMSGASKVSIEDRQKLNDLLPLLDALSRQHPDNSVREMATDLRIAIATHGHVLSDALRDAAQQKSKPTREKKDAEEIKPEVNAQETKKLKTEERKKPLIEVISSQDVADITAEKSTSPNVTNNGQNVQLDSKVQAVKKTEDREYISCNNAKPSDKKSDLDVAFEELMDPLIPVRGHALITLRRLLETKNPEALEKQDLLLKVFQENLDHADSYIYLAAIQGMSVLADRLPDEVLPCLTEQYTKRADKHTSPELRIKVGEVLVKTCRNMGDMAPKYRDLLLSSLLTGARDADPLVRASAMSNLGEVCKTLHYSLGSCVHEIFGCVSSLIKTDSDSEVRKASAMFCTLLLQGLGQDTIKVLDSVLLDLYRILKHVVRTEQDQTVLLHVQLALDELDQIMRQYLFPRQTLTKRIHVLDPPP